MKNNFPLFLLLLGMLFSMQLNAQWILINEGGGNPDASAALEIQANDRGFLMPRMNSANRLAIATPEEGLLVYQTDGIQGFYYYNGAAWDTLRGTTVNSLVTNVNNSKVAVVRDIKASGIDGGTFANGAWRIRDLNTLEGDNSFISINGTTNFTLDSGVYDISVSAPAFEVTEHQCRLFNVTSSTVETVGTNAFADGSSSNSIINTVISISTSSTFRIEHRCEVTIGGNGFGDDATWGNNIYTQVRIQKLD